MAIVRRMLQVVASDTSDFCSSVRYCLKDGSVTCDTTTGDCPPCIYALGGTYTCWKKDNSTNTCPFTGVRYDCSDSWGSTTTTHSTITPATHTPTSSSSSSSSSSSETETDSSSSTIIAGLNSSQITYGAIGLGVFLVLVIFSILCARRCKMRRRRRANLSDTGMDEFGCNRLPSDKHPRSVSKPRDDAFSGLYNNILDTSKVNYSTPSTSSDTGRSHASQRIGSRSSRMDSYQLREAPRSFDGILSDSAQLPAVLGGNLGLHNNDVHSVRSAPVADGTGGFPCVNEYVQHDVSSRCSSTPNVFGEYLRMKQEMQFDEGDRSIIDGMSDVSFSDTVSDLDSGKYSLESSQGINRLPQRPINPSDRSSMADSITDSIADSEYAEQIRERIESDCYSEMSYNDERYSFSSLDGLDDSQIRESKREVEI